MATTNATTQERTAVRPAAGHDNLLPRHQRLGRDREGYDHHLNRDARVVLRVEPETGEVWHRADLTELDCPELGNAIEAYIHDYVAEQVGWDDRSLTTRDLFGEQLP